MIHTKTNNSAEKLGFQKLESAEIVNQLNIVLSTYQVFFHKLQNFHWNVVGSDFFDIHDMTQEMYETALTNIDELAERVRVFGQVPAYKMTDYLERSLIKESAYDLSAEFMAREISADLRILIETLIGLHEASTLNGDIGGTHMASELVKELETTQWKLNSWCNRKFSAS